VYAAETADAEGICGAEFISSASRGNTVSGAICCISIAICARSVRPANAADDAGASATAVAADHGSRFSHDASTTERRATTSGDSCDGTNIGCCCNEESCTTVAIVHTATELLQLWTAWTSSSRLSQRRDGAATSTVGRGETI